MTRMRLRSVILIIACVAAANPVLAGWNDSRIADLIAASKAIGADPIDADRPGRRKGRNDG